MSAPHESAFVTFGCRLNAFETEVMRGHAAAAGLDDAIVVNTCAVTGEAVRQARQAIRRARREHPRARIVATGCAVQTAPDAFAGMAEIDHLLGNREKLEAASFAALASPAAGRVQVSDIMAARTAAGHGGHGFEGRARAFVQVQNGCDHRCTFCIIPFGRGPSRSVPVQAVVDQVRARVAEGFAEVVLTGVDITAYGADLAGGPTLGSLVQRLLAEVPDLPRLRLSSIDSVEVDEPLFAAVASEPRVMPHLHLSLQAGHDMILKRMKRRHNAAEAVAFCARLRAARPDIALGADLIAGFPTEDEAMFEATLAHVADCGLTWLHVFPFSPRPGTPAARMPQLDRRIVKERAGRLRAAAGAARARFLAGEVGARRQVLVERGRLGRTEHNAEVLLAGAAAPGSVVPVRITGVDGGRLMAERAA